MRDIHLLILALQEAEKSVLNELKKQYPVGTKVVYKLRGGKDALCYQEQEGKVVGHIGGLEGRLRVELAQSRSAKYTGHTRRYVTSMPIFKIIRRGEYVASPLEGR